MSQTTDLQRYDILNCAFEMHDPDNSVAAETISGNMYEPATTYVLDEFLRDGQPVFIDIGSHYGYFPCYVGRLNPNARIYCVEPGRESKELLQQNIDLNGIRAQIIERAVSDANGEAEFSWRTIEPRLPRGEKYAVRTQPLPELLNELNVTPDVIKIDVHGAEGRILRGALPYLAQFDGLVILELHAAHLLVGATHEEIATMLASTFTYVLEARQHRSLAHPLFQRLTQEEVRAIGDFSTWEDEQINFERMLFLTNNAAKARTLLNLNADNIPVSGTAREGIAEEAQ
ncbi:FkbM family methyltransferase [Deinococcus aluminii]|uniref:Methyltransferase FkbM domain-containing protein n=1 Tax=Deinococcus aluminii TaxID=1656885 RepID=A0ABP9XHF4_9DEIO